MPPLRFDPLFPIQIWFSLFQTKRHVKSLAVFFLNQEGTLLGQFAALGLRRQIALEAWVEF